MIAESDLGHTARELAPSRSCARTAPSAPERILVADGAAWLVATHARSRQKSGRCHVAGSSALRCLLTIVAGQFTLHSFANSATLHVRG